MICLAAALAAPSLDALPAFPGAEGLGAGAKGARAVSNPTVYRVTNLADSGTGSFRDAVSAPGRVVVFEVAGILRVGAPIVVSPSLTILGQTAPGDGITLYGNRLSFSGAHNTICRYLRIRMGIDGDDGADAVGVASGADMIFDHVSASWGRDETFSISGDAAMRITLQDCLIAQGLRIHSAGGLMQTSGGVSIFRTLYADNWMRNPKVKGVNDYVNNVVYNWGGGGGYIPAGDSAGDSFANVIANYFIAGPETGAGRSPFSTGNRNFRMHHAGNLQDLDLDGALNGTPVGDASFSTLQLVATRYSYPRPVTEFAAPDALAWVLQHAGASRRRDRTDLQVIGEVRSWGTQGAFIFNESDLGGIGTLDPGMREPDTDSDGVPDWWEIASGTRPDIPDATGVAADGYLNVERYANALAVGGVPGAFVTAISDDSGSSPSDGITSDRTLVLVGTSAAGARVDLHRADTGLIGTVTAAVNGTWSFDYTATALQDRPYAFTAVATVAGVQTPPSPAFVVNVDTLPAAPPAITGLALSPVATLSGTAGAWDRVVVSLDGTVVGSAVADARGNWTAAYSGTPPASGVRSFVATATDRSGNEGGGSVPYTVDLGITPPEFTSLTSDTGESASDRVTNDTTLVLAGRAPPGAGVTVVRVGGGPGVPVVAGSDGRFSFDNTAAPLAQGTHVFVATATVGGRSSPVSAPFSIQVDTTAPGVDSIRRHQPATYSTNGGTVAFRVTFSEPVRGVTLADFTLTNTGATATLGMVTEVTPSLYEVAVTGVSGDGTVRLNLAASGTGIVDAAGNTVAGGYTSGQTYTVRLAGSGVWINLDEDGLWTDDANWDGGIIAGGVGATADFSLRDLVSNTALVLNGSRTLGRIVLGDTDPATPAGWTLGDAGVPGSILTLAATGQPVIQVDAATSPLGDTTDVPAAAAFPHHLAVNLSGTAGFAKTGVGTLELNRPNSGLSGPLAITRGIVQLGPGGELRPSSVSIATSQQLRVAGGSFSTTGSTSWSSGTGTGVIVSAGSATFQDVVPSNTRNSFFRVTGGTVSGRDMNFPRSGDSEAQTTGTGVLISGGETTFRTIGLGTNNSWAGMTVSGGRITVTDTLVAGYQTTAGRGGVIYLQGGELVVPGSLVLGRKAGSNANNVGKLLITGGTARLGRLLLGYDPTVTAGSALVSMTSGALYLGAGGLVKNGTAGLSSTLSLAGGTLGALADWSTSHPVTLSGTGTSLVIRAADPQGLAHAITLSGPITGTGGLTKTGAGMLTLAGTSTLGDSLSVSEGELRLEGPLGATAGRSLTVAGGARLSGTVAPSMNLDVLNDGTVSPGGNSAAIWTVPSMRLMAGSRLLMNVGTTSDRITTTSGTTFGSASGTILFSFLRGTLAPGTTYPLLSGPVNLGSATLSTEGLGFVEGELVTGSDGVSLRINRVPALGDLEDWLTARALPASRALLAQDADGDGRALLLDYLLGAEPGAPAGHAVPTAGTLPSGGEVYPTLSYRRRLARGDVAVFVEAAGPGLDFAAGIATAEVSAQDQGDGFERVTVRSTLPLSMMPAQFLRLRVQAN